MSTGRPEAEAVRLVGDVGGTNARFALLHGSHGTPQSQIILRTADHPDLGSAIQEYLRQVGEKAPLEAAVAVATPISSDRVQLTNGRWSFSIEETRQRLGLRRLLLLNDFAALAQALPSIPPPGLEQMGGGNRVPNSPLALIGPGTGLGVASLVPIGERWLPLPGEGGHVTMCATNSREAAIISALWPQYPHVSAERLLSGSGLVNLYQAIATLEGQAATDLAPADVTRLGLSGEDPHCAEAIKCFCAMLGTVAGNLAVTLGARGGVFIGGGIVPRLGDYFARSPFRQRFEEKGRFSAYLTAIPSFVIRAPDVGLLGAAIALGVDPEFEKNRTSSVSAPQQPQNS